MFGKPGKWRPFKRTLAKCATITVMVKEIQKLEFYKLLFRNMKVFKAKFGMQCYITFGAIEFSFLMTYKTAKLVLSISNYMVFTIKT